MQLQVSSPSLSKGPQPTPSAPPSPWPSLSSVGLVIVAGLLLGLGACDGETSQDEAVQGLPAGEALDAIQAASTSLRIAGEQAIYSDDLSAQKSGRAVATGSDITIENPSGGSALWSGTVDIEEDLTGTITSQLALTDWAVVSSIGIQGSYQATVSGQGNATVIYNAPIGSTLNAFYVATYSGDFSVTVNDTTYNVSLDYTYGFSFNDEGIAYYLIGRAEVDGQAYKFDQSINFTN